MNESVHLRIYVQEKRAFRVYTQKSLHYYILYKTCICINESTTGEI